MSDTTISCSLATDKGKLRKEYDVSLGENESSGDEVEHYAKSFIKARGVQIQDTPTKE